LIADGAPAVGASGAISGILGMYLAIYPTNKISCCYFFFMRTGTFEIDGYLLIIFWFVMDFLHTFNKADHIAHWAHIGGTLGGFAAGVLLLKLGLVDRTEVDHPTVLGLISKEETGS
jgi:membrane associated rhomboid family serine protease